jgi:flagellar motility protein MotE (MotC chaperone)
MKRPRILPIAVTAMGALFVLKAETLWRGVSAPAGQTAAPTAFAVIAPARASEEAPAPAAAPVPAAAPAPAPATTLAAASAAAAPDPAVAAERAVLEQLRARRAELEAREQAAAQREVMLAAAERRLQQRIEELSTMRGRLEAMERARGERDEAGWRGLVRLYENMRARDAAAIFDDLEMPVLVQILDRMGERKAAPVIGAMRPDRARMLTAELARFRAQRNPNN